MLLDADGGAATLHSLVRPPTRPPRVVERLTGLAAEDLAVAPTPAALAAPLADALLGHRLLTHDAALLRQLPGPLSRVLSAEPATGFAAPPALDGLELLALTHPDAPDLRLETFTRRLLGEQGRHRALDAARDTLRLLARVAAGARAGEPRYVVARTALERFDPGSPWLTLLASGRALSTSGDSAQFVPVPASDEPPVAFDEEAIARVLADEARCRRWLPSYRVRDEQIRLAREFTRALGDGGRLLLEGGTGVGKSLAYLAAAIPFAMERAAGGIRQPVVVSTRTKLLQDQLLQKDIPAAAGLLGYPELRALSIKGRANYVCARRLEPVLAEGSEPRLLAEDRRAFAALASCARTRPHGEVGALPGALLSRFPLLRDLVRRSVAARAEHCSREQCARERACPFGRRRAALGRAQLVVANHDLLLRWPPDYPAFTHAILDEAHELAGVVDEAFADEVRPAEVLERIDDLFGRPAAVGAGARSGAAREPALLSAAARRQLATDAVAWRHGIREDLAALGDAVADRASEFGELELPRHADRVLPHAARAAASAAARLEDLAAAAERAAPPDDAAEPSPVDRVCGELRGAAETLRAVFSHTGEDAVAAFESLAPPFDRWRLVVRPVAPGPAFHARFADRLEALLCVSASLFVGGDPFAALGELELESRREFPAERVSVASPFAYDRHMRVVALESAGDAVRDTADVLAELARRLGGRTLGLFTSLRRMDDVAALLARELRGEGFDVLAPRRASDDPAALVERFRRAGSGVVLLGARTFWQGVDIPGSALQAVVIEKLPFERPTQLRARREERLRAEGLDAFERYTTGKMLLNLKQMVGRLIRSEDDRGLVAIVDARTDRPYFARLGEALPPRTRVELARSGELDRVLAEIGLAPQGAVSSPASSSTWISTSR